MQSFEDTASLLKECDVRAAYEDAEALFEAGNYSATGTVYVNPDYQSSVVPLTIRNQSGNTFFKIYNYDALAMTIFIRSGESANVSLPAGAYRMNEAHGEQWFGDKDMFGDEGSYFKCTFGGDETTELEWGYSYEITTSYGLAPGSTGMGSEEIDKDSF